MARLHASIFPLLFATLELFVTSGCAKNGSESPLLPAASAHPSTTPEPADAWPMQSRDVNRDGFQSSSLAFDSSSAPQLTLNWSAQLSNGIAASPVLASGRLVAATISGQVLAFDENTGKQLWSVDLGAVIHGTPTIADGVVFVPLYTPGGVAAIRISDGTLLWNVAATSWGANGPVRTEPLVSSGNVYVGTAGGDPPQCFGGTVTALSETTGARIWSIQTSSANGIGVWSPISLTPNGDIAAGTGNACIGTPKIGQTYVAFNGATGAVDWTVQTAQVGPDVDVGGGLAETPSGVGYFTSKDGRMYAVRLTDGSVIWSISLGATAGYGSIATPATNGTNIVTQTGALSDPTTTSNPGSYLVDVAPSGQIIWKSSQLQSEQFSSPAIVNDVVVAGIDNALQVRRLSDGGVVWSFDCGSFLYASPAITSSGIFETTTGGEIYAFALPKNSEMRRSRR